MVSIAKRGAVRNGVVREWMTLRRDDGKSDVGVSRGLLLLVHSPLLGWPDAWSEEGIVGVVL